jgi:hypothetical protein
MSYDGSIAHSNEAVRIAGCEVDVVENEDNRLAQLVGRLTQPLLHAVGMFHIKVVQQLVRRKPTRLSGLRIDRRVDLPAPL